MKKEILFNGFGFISALFLACHAPAATEGASSFSSLAARYQDFKKTLTATHGLSYSFDFSEVMQRGAPNGKGTVWQSMGYGTLNWDMFQSSTWGSGSFQAAYTGVRYSGLNGNQLGNRVHVITGINDETAAVNTFDQLSYTHTLPGKADGVSFLVGQYPIYNFDGGDYNSNQQINFINEALSQNASSAYPTASLGGVITLAPSTRFSLSIGAQNARNITGETISLHKFGKGRFTSFVNAAWTPSYRGLAGQYSVILYHQPAVPAQPQQTRGWSINLQQAISSSVTLFARANGTNQSQESIRQSYVAGGVINNPLNRNHLDQIGLAAAFNKLNRPLNGAGTRSWENVVEAYWAWGVSDFLTLTPDIQVYINPGKDPDHKTAVITSLRATVMF